MIVTDGDPLQSARYMRDIMSAQKLHHDGQSMEEMVKSVIEQLKEARRQEEVRANELFVGRDRDMQLILGLLGVNSYSRSNLTKEDKQTIQQFSDRIKGNNIYVYSYTWKLVSVGKKPLYQLFYLLGQGCRMMFYNLYQVGLFPD